MLIVQKFGGSSLAGTERLRRAAGIAAEARRRGHSVLVVVSAMGDTTDELLDMAHEISSQPPARELDALISTGEQQSAALMAITLESMGLAARSFTGWQAGIITDGSHAEARIEMIAPPFFLQPPAIALPSGCSDICSADAVSRYSSSSLTPSCMLCAATT